MKKINNDDLLSKQVAEYNAPVDGNLQLGAEISPLIAEFSRDGVDLILTSENGDFITINDYFSSFPGADLLTAGGARITSDVVSKLSGPGPLAQSTSTQSDADGPIGEVTELSGTVTAKHVDGTIDELVPGAAVFQGDVLETGTDGSFAILFADETQFSMGENGRAVLDEMIYNPSGGEGSFGVSLLQGVFSLVSGQIAKDDADNVSVKTPVGTIGIRGTSWSGHVKNVGEESIFTLFTGAIVIANEGGSQFLSIANQSVIVRSFSSAPESPVILTADQLYTIYGDALQLVNPNWFDEQDQFDPTRIEPEGGNRSNNTGGGADFQQFAALAISDGLGSSDLLESAQLLGDTILNLNEIEAVEGGVSDGPDAKVSVNTVRDPVTGNIISYEVVIGLDEPSGLPVTITYDVRPGTASADDFVVDGDGTAIIPAGQLSTSFTVTVTDDDVVENLEFFIIELIGADNANISFAFKETVVVIVDDDIGVVRITEATLDGTAIANGEVGEGAGVLSFELVLDKPLAAGAKLDIDYVISGTASEGSDYSADAVKTATFDGGETGLPAGATISIDVPLLDDDVYEGTESLTISIVGASENVVVDGDADVLSIDIIDDEPAIDIESPEAADLDEADTDGSVVDGSLGVTGGSGTLSSVIFDAEQIDFAASNVSSGGSDVVLSGLGTDTIVGTAGGATIFTITLSEDGTYDMTLDGPLDHSDGFGNVVPLVEFDLAFTAFDEAGASVSGVLGIEVKDSAPILGIADNVILDEDDLPEGSDISPESSTATGVVAIDMGLDGFGSVALTIDNLPSITSRGDNVEYDLTTLSDGVTQRVTATAVPENGAPRTVFTLDFAPNGDGDNFGYSMTLQDVVDHGGAGEDSLLFTFGYDVEDNDGSSASGSFSTTIVDDAPLASPDDVILEAPQLPAYNLVLILDTSGSMSQGVSGGSGTRMDVLKQSVSNLLGDYGEASRAVNITIIGFSSAASIVYSGTSISDAQAFIGAAGNLIPSGGTSYAAAVADSETGAQGVLNANLDDPNLEGFNHIAYFISDGAPNSGQGVPTAGGNDWQNFADGNNIEVVAVGIGNGTDTDELANVENAGQDPIVVIDPNDLDSVLEDTVPVVESDNVVSSGVVDLLGADGGTLTSLTYNSINYDIPQNSDPLIIETDLGGSLSIDMDGNYTYTAPQSAEPGAEDSFEYFLTDGDGDSSSAVLSVNFVSEIFQGDGGAELLVGSDGDDWIAGNGGNDTLQGNGGNDILEGGSGADVFAITGAYLSGPSDPDFEITISDFDAGEDTVDLDQIFDVLGLLTEDRGQGDAWDLSEINGQAALTFTAANTPVVFFSNQINPDNQALDDIASKITVDES
ncbi:VWA domain-containing protein [Sneathiella marina]|uniref:VWA domain-containing protein n=1 Tax=Sneathiella marina TaxID=2950108 RepID=A0ABY4W193_9PROT|nr:Calx-beta domain-containing protein [Sneathiella marina]USG60614.1 VWA domain-containing protein [Sneathiella marina]